MERPHSVLTRSVLTLTILPSADFLQPKAHSRFNQQVYAALVRHFDLDTLKVVIIASPGFTKESVYQFILDEAVVKNSLLRSSRRY